MNIQRICKALYKYEAVEEGELSFEEDSLLYIVDDSDEAWWKASTELNSTDEANIGLIPYNYVEEIDYIAKYRAVYDYEAQGEDELSFEEGVEISVYQVEGEDWMLGCINGNFGFVPQNYTEEIIEDTSEQNNYAEEGYMEEYEDVVEEVEQELSQASKNINESVDQHSTTPLSTKKIAKDDMLFWRVSEVDKSKKKKQKVRLGISSNMIFVASEEEKGSPVKQWAISDLVSYSLKNKHIIVELSGKDSITFDFSCSSIKQAEAIAFKIKSCSDAVYREKTEDKNSKGFFGMFKKSTKSSATPPKSYQQHSPQYNQSDNVPTIKDKYETVPLPPIPQEEIDRASEQQKQFYPETRTQLRAPSNNSISSTPSKAGNESKKGKPAIVVYDFDAAEEGELSVVADKRIYVLDSDTDSDWWRCRIYRSDEDYDEGFVPAEYVTLLPSDVPQSSVLAGGNKVANELSSIMVREWTDTTGSFKVEAEFIKFSENKIHLHKVNGVKIAVPIEKMSMVDLKYVSELIGEDLTESLDSTRKQNAESEKWLRFFKDCNVADNEAQTYATTFTKEKIDRGLLKSMDKSSLKDLGLVEGDAIRVLNAIKSDNISKAPKGKRSVTFNPNTTVIDPSKDEELAYKLQQEEIERVRKEKASGSFVELQIEQDEMLARRLQGQGDSNGSWEGFSDLGTSSSESKKYGLGLSGGLGSKPKGKSSSIDQQKIAKATEFLEAENQKENKNKVKDDDKSKSQSKSKSGFDDDIWGVPGQRATYQKKTPPTVAKDITPVSPTTVSPPPPKATVTSSPWAVFPDSNTKPSSTAPETPIFSSDNSARRDTKGKSNSALDQDWSSLSAEFSKISVNDSATAKPIKVAPEVTKKGNQDFAIFTKVQQASPRRPSTPQLTQPQIQQPSSMLVQQQQTPAQQIQNNVPVILAQPLIPVPSGNLSNVFIPTRRPAPPKPTQNQNVFGDANATFSSNSSVSSLPVNNQSSKAPDNMQVGASIFNQSAQNKESGSIFSTISTPNTQSSSNIFGSNSNTQPSVNVFGPSTTPSNKSNGNTATSNQEQALDLFGANLKTLSPMSDIKREGSMSSLASFSIPHNNSDSSSTPLNSSMLLNKNLDTFDSKNFNYKNDFAMDSPIISERSFSGNLHDTSMSTINLPSNMDYSISTTTTSRTKTSSSNYQFDDLSLKSLGVASTPKIPQYSSGNSNQNIQTQGSANYNLGMSQNSNTGLGSTFDSVPRLMDSTPVKLNEFDQFRMELDKPSSLNQSFDINTGSNALNESLSYNTINAHSGLNKETSYGTASSLSYTESKSNLNTMNVNQSVSSSFSSTIQGNSYNLLSSHTTPTANLTRSLTPTLSNTNNNNMGYSIGGYNTLDSTKTGLHTSSSLNDIPGLHGNNTNNLNMNSSLLNNSFNTSGNLSHNQTGLNSMTGHQSNFNSSRNEFNTSLSSSKLLGMNQSGTNNNSGLNSTDYNSSSMLGNSILGMSGNSNVLGMSGNSNVLGMSSNSGLGTNSIGAPNNFSSLSMSSNLQQDKLISSHSNLGLAGGNMNDYSYTGNAGSSFGQNNGMNGLGNNSGMSGLGSTYGNNNINNNNNMNVGLGLNNYTNTTQYTNLSTNSMSSMNINSNLNNNYSSSPSSYGNHLNTSLNSSSLNNSTYNQNTSLGGGLNSYTNMDLNRPIGNNSSLGYNNGLQGNMMNQQLNQGMNSYQQQGQGMNNYQQQGQNMGGYQQQFNPMNNNNNFNSNNYGQGNNYRM